MFWGKEKEDTRCSYCIEQGYDSCSVCDDRIAFPNYLKHLQRIVLEKEPLQYLKKFL